MNITVRKIFSSDVDIYKRYISVVLSFSGKHIAPLPLSILAHGVKFGKITKAVKEEVSNAENCDLQSVANAMTTLRKIGYLTKDNEVMSKLVPPSLNFTLNLKYAQATETKS